HEDFYLHVKEHTQLGVAYCPTFVAYHHAPEDASYMSKRGDLAGWAEFARKWEVDQCIEPRTAFRAIYARGHVHVPIEETCDPQLLGNHARFEFATKQRPFCAATQYGVPRDPNVELRIISPLPGDVVQDQVFSLLVALDNKGGLIGCLGDDAPCLMTGPI